MANRYKNRTIFTNDLNQYKNVFRERNVKFIRQYETPAFGYPDKNDIKKFDIVAYTWSAGDSYYKIAYQFYGDEKAWWVIAKFNNKPTEANIKVGDILLIPTPLPKVLNYLTG